MKKLFKINEDHKVNKNNFWITVSKYAKSYKKELIISMIFSLLTGVAVAVQPLIIKYIVDNGIQNLELEPTTRISHRLS